MFCSVLKKISHKSSKGTAAKDNFSTVYVTGTAWFWWIFYSMWLLEDLIFHDSLLLLGGFFSTAMLLFSLKEVFWKKSVFCIISPMPITTFKKKVLYCIVNVSTNFVFWYVFPIFDFETVPLFFFMNDFFGKKSSLEVHLCLLLLYFWPR